MSLFKKASLGQKLYASFAAVLVLVVVSGVVAVVELSSVSQAAKKLYQAAEIISRNPAALQLRYLQTLLELGAGQQTSTIVFPLPLDLVRGFLGGRGDGGAP